MKTPEVHIKAVNLAKSVKVADGSLTILHDISLTINHGETVAIVGASGSGKSTLLSLLAGLDLPTKGEVLLAGQPLHQLSEDQRAAIRASSVGFVFQSFLLLPSLTALENVTLPAELSGISDARERGLNLLRQVGLAERADFYPAQLSGGEQQRVAIARAFITRPAVLFADEPSANLDAATGQKIEDLLFKLNAEQGTTLVLVTHNNELAARCQRQYKMQAGSFTSTDLKELSDVG
ncbi:MAG: ATP-binding cassette domain-containing protein [Gammaproteobacteria bacterium]|nr:ATP-binding cassette domain-containing protein [Gammaproteobacteria bacterium]MBU1556944.1 ATP-binding cassette domain-containing protein [Gammaproteobacteria bacterium]MBU2071807.1 ATP-binding cassette domain-containing protein [Gammaproteobacteria bacterium]MBU2184125.1 ATP-binding cassette domain-containing protein [Gammaproteobacteria bacterium]MBU2204278.1 ATP-binding cassette domain-containing protein [Gammaproteobacteria bacterium]